MSLIRWEPFRDMDEFFKMKMPRGFGRMPRFLEGDGDIGVAWAPTADISETEKEFLIRAELPAVKKEDVKITVEQGMITIEGFRKEEKEEKDEKFHRVESFRGNFSRSFAMPENVDEKAIRAESKDGVLTVHLPKTRAEKPKSLEVRVQ
jgi:HSP20 family protein